MFEYYRWIMNQTSAVVVVIAVMNAIQNDMDIVHNKAISFKYCTAFRSLLRKVAMKIAVFLYIMPYHLLAKK